MDLTGLVEACGLADDLACQRLGWAAISQPPPAEVPCEPPADAGPLAALLACPPPGLRYGAGPSDRAARATYTWAVAQLCGRGDPLACDVLEWTGPGAPSAALPDPLPDLVLDTPTSPWTGTWVGHEHTVRFSPREVEVDGQVWAVSRAGLGVLWATGARQPIPPPCASPPPPGRSECERVPGPRRRVKPTWRFDRVDPVTIRCLGPGHPIAFEVVPEFEGDGDE